MFAVTIHFPNETLVYSTAMTATDILNFEVLMVAHGYVKLHSKVSKSKESKIATLQYDIWFEEK